MKRLFRGYLLFQLLILTILLCTCEQPDSIFSGDVENFVEEGLSLVSLRHVTEFSTGTGADTLKIPSGRQAEILITLNNPKNVAVTWELVTDTPDLLAGPADLPVTQNNRTGVLTLTPSIDAERRDIRFTLKMISPTLNGREFPDQSFTLRCDSPPSAPILAAGGTADNRGFLGFRLPAQFVPDDDIIAAELTWRVFANMNDTPLKRTVSLTDLQTAPPMGADNPLGMAGPLDRFWQPSGSDAPPAGKAIRFTVTLVDAAGQISETTSALSEDVICRLEYDPNGGTGNPPVDQEGLYGTDVSVADGTVLSLTDWSFQEWNTRPDGSGTVYAPGDTIVLDEPVVTLYAVWVAGPLRVTYLANGGSGNVPTDNNLYGYGTDIRILRNTGSLRRSGQVFVCWNTRADGTGFSYAPEQSMTITSNLTLYAQYVSGSFIAGGNCQHLGPVYYQNGSLTNLSWSTVAPFGTFCHDVFIDASGTSPVDYAAGSNWNGSHHDGMIWIDGVPGTPLSGGSHVYVTSLYPYNGKIYVCGFDGSEASNQSFYAVYDSAGANPSRFNIGGTGPGNMAHEILVDNGDVFVGGQSGNGAVVWKNGAMKHMPGANGAVHALALSGDTLYAVGRSGISACYWKSEDRGDSWGDAVMLIGGTEARSIVINNSVIHVCGIGNTGPLYWEGDSQPVDLPDGMTANSLTLIGGQPYIVGNEKNDVENERTILWIGGKAYYLWAFQGTPSPDDDKCVRANAIAAPARTVTFDHNGAFLPEGTMGPQVFLEGQTLPLRANRFIKTGWSFAGWSTTPGGVKVYDDGGAFTMGAANVTLYAVWSHTGGFAVGDVGPADGRIVFVNNAAGTDGWTYMEAAPDDDMPDTASSDLCVPRWSNITGVAVGGLVDAIGAGKRNTLLIMGQMDHTESAASYCALPDPDGVAEPGEIVSFHGYGFNDWFLPTYEEMALAGTHKAKLGMTWDYWTSFEVDGSSVYIANFSSASPGAYTRNKNLNSSGYGAQVRPMRVFNTAGTPVRLIAYHANGGINPPADKCYDQGVTATIVDPGTGMAYDDNFFLCLNTKPDGSGTTYAVDSSYQVGTEDLLLYAIWGENLGATGYLFIGFPTDPISSDSGSYTQINYGSEPGFTHDISPFRIAKYEVTWTLWNQVRLWGEGHGYTFAHRGSAAGDDFPVANISWRDAIVWCNAYSQMKGITPCYTYQNQPIKDSTNAPACDNSECEWAMGGGYRLPTEGEWQLAASGGGSTPYNSAAGSSSGYVNGSSPADIYNAVAWCQPSSGSHPQTVGGKTANQYNLFDMSGNVSEWCWDWLGNYPTSTQTNYSGPGSGTSRVIKGGGANDYANAMMIGARNGYSPGTISSGTGFRVVVSGN